MTRSVSTESQGLLPNEVRSGWSDLGYKSLKLITMLGLGSLTLDIVGLPTLGHTFVPGLIAGQLLIISLAVLVSRRIDTQLSGVHSDASSFVSSLTNTLLFTTLWLLMAEATFQTAHDWHVTLFGLVAGCVSEIWSRHRATRYRMSISNAEEAQASVEVAISDDMVELASIHEAGHALTLGILPAPYIENCYVTLQYKGQIYTATPSLSEGMTNVIMLRWEMFMYLAGPIASNRHFQSPMEGNANDMGEWRRRALAVLTAESPAGWVHGPQDECEYQCNEQLIHSLMLEQTAAVETFLGLNQGIYDQLVSHLRTHLGASSQELAGLVKDVKVNQQILKALRVD